MDSSLTVLFPLRSTSKCCCLSLQNISRISPLLTHPLLSVWSETPLSPPKISAINSLLTCILASSFASFKSALNSRPCHTVSWISSLLCSDPSGGFSFPQSENQSPSSGLHGPVWSDRPHPHPLLMFDCISYSTSLCSFSSCLLLPCCPMSVPDSRCMPTSGPLHLQLLC